VRKTARHKRLFILLYFKAYPLQEVLGLLFGRSQPQAHAWIHRWSGVLQKVLGQAGHLPERGPAKLHEVLQACGQLEFIMDGTERRGRRPREAARQKAHYSGKKKTHPQKNVGIRAGPQVKCLSQTHPGSHHDKTVAEAEWRGRGFPAGSRLLQDSGFQGLDPVGVEVWPPIKKPRGRRLEPRAQQATRALSRVRVQVEHVLSGVKRCRIVAEVFRNLKAGFNDLVMEVACGLHNFRVRCRSPA
jgi:hypothetical protein